MSNQYKLSYSTGAYPKNLALFSVPVTDVSTYMKQVVDFSSKNPLEDKRLLFHLEGIRNQLIVLNEIKLEIRGKIVNENGGILPPVPSGTWSTTKLTGDSNKTAEEARQALQKKFIAADVFPVNNFFYSLFKDGTMTIQNTKIFLNDIGYRGIIETSMKNSFDKNDRIMTQFYIPTDSKSEENESIIPTHPNTSHNGYVFHTYTDKSNEIEMFGKLLFPICEQEKLLLSHVDVQIEMMMNYPDFYLRHPHDQHKYKFMITDCKLSVPLITLPPDVEIAQAEVLTSNPALYSFNDKKLTVHSVPSGSYQFEHINTWSGDVPSRLTVLMLPSKNYNGTLSTDPFAFVHNNVNFAEVSVDNQPVGGRSMKLRITGDEKTSLINDAYCSVINNYPNMNLTREQWLDLFPVYYFNINSNYTDEVLPLIRKGLTKVLFKFATPLTEDTTVLMQAEFPGLLEIDGVRNVSI